MVKIFVDIEFSLANTYIFMGVHWFIKYKDIYYVVSPIINTKIQIFRKLKKRKKERE